MPPKTKKSPGGKATAGKTAITRPGKSSSAMNASPNGGGHQDPNTIDPTVKDEQQDAEEEPLVMETGEEDVAAEEQPVEENTVAEQKEKDAHRSTARDEEAEPAENDSKTPLDLSKTAPEASASPAAEENGDEIGGGKSPSPQPPGDDVDAEKGRGGDEGPDGDGGSSVAKVKTGPQVVTIPTMSIPSSSPQFTAHTFSESAGRMMMDDAEAISRAATATVQGCNAVLKPFKDSLAETKSSQQHTKELLKDAQMQARQIEVAMAKAEPTFAKLPLYTEKLAKIRRNMQTLEFNVKKIRRQACDIKSEVNAVLEPRLHPPSKR